MIVSDIQRFSIHDGPGIRTTVFLKGCNLRCHWCHNPETLRQEAEVQFVPGRCVGCGACLSACPNQAHSLTDGSRRFDRSLCEACGRCAAGCYARALAMVGRDMTVEQVMAEVSADREFYDNSGGGVTLSGGEPLFQPDAASELLAACKAEGIHTAIETNLAWPWSRVEAVLPVTDLVMLDIKLMDPAEHRRWTGAGNEQVLANARRLSAEGVPTIVRTPVIGGVNATAGKIGKIADFVSGLEGLLYYELLAYNLLGMSKYEGLGMEPPAEEFARPGAAAMESLAAEAGRRGVEVRCRDGHGDERIAE